MASPPTSLQEERGVKCLVWACLLCLLVLVIALHTLLFSLVVALHVTPLSPWRGAGVRLFPLGEGRG